MTMMTDPAAEHEIVIRSVTRDGGHKIGVSCRCLARHKAGGGHEPIEVRERWQPGEAQQVWAAWHAERKAAVV